MKKSKKTALILLLVSLITISLAITSYAVTSNPYGVTSAWGWPDNYYIYYAYGQDTATGSIYNYSSKVNEAASIWNATPAHVMMYSSSQSSANLYVHNGPFGSTGWHALFTPRYLTNDRYHNIAINEYYSGAYGSNIVELIVHEMGHGHGLVDTSWRGTPIPIMRDKGYNNSPYPTSYDVSGVNERYPN